jgi:hypothetical protein
MIFQSNMYISVSFHILIELVVTYYIISNISLFSNLTLKFDWMDVIMLSKMRWLRFFKDLCPQC